MVLAVLLLSTALLAEITVATHPAVVRVEAARHANNLNFDFEITNGSDAAIRLRDIQMEAFDEHGHLITRRKVGYYGTAPSILTIPNRDIAAHESVMLFNPFVAFPPALPIARIDYRFVYGPAADDDAEDLPAIRASVPISSARTVTVLHAPMKGRLIVDDGHDFLAHHRRVNVKHRMLAAAGVTKNPVRYAIDLCTMDSEGKRFRTDGKTREDWYSWNQPVYAAAGGTVARARNDRDDYVIGKTSFDYGEMVKDPSSLYGNYVMIDHSHGEYSVYVHLMNGSVRVSAGDRVKAGQEIGRAGNSGDAGEPHLHMQMQDSSDLNAEGLPMYFTGFHRIYENTWIRSPEPIDTGEIIEWK